ncbi:MAG: vitamin K epoxide reductase [Calditrichaeota bacterium]|jgi:uncharacterized membrane protein|nr:vitamin K epoxide reductase [Anaerolineae bacterium]MBT7617045.1 vitamin K epoxide reductase [Calditrichota bacterium]
MKKRHYIFPVLVLCLFLILLFPAKGNAQGLEPVVRAVLFFSPSCSHCHEIIQEYFPALFEEFDKQLEIVRIDISEPIGEKLYFSAVQSFAISDDRLGVPTLIIGNNVLVGSLEIPNQFKELVEQTLAEGGVDWPNIPGLDEILKPVSDQEASTAIIETPPPSDLSADTDVAQSITPFVTIIPTIISQDSVSSILRPELALTNEEDFDWLTRFSRDRAGNTLGIFTLIAMLVSFPGAIVLYRKNDGMSFNSNWSWLIPFFCLIGLGIASYLSYVEMTFVAAICGPIGDCNAVQQSEYARLFDIIPIGILGVIGYIAILFSWVFLHYANTVLANSAAVSLLVVTSIGTLFSIYLTFLELFVIGAICIWCITSAILMTVLMLLSIYPAKFVLLNSSFKGK